MTSIMGLQFLFLIYLQYTISLNLFRQPANRIKIFVASVGTYFVLVYSPESWVIAAGLNIAIIFLFYLFITHRLTESIILMLADIIISGAVEYVALLFFYLSPLDFHIVALRDYIITGRIIVMIIYAALYFVTKEHNINLSDSIRGFWLFNLSFFYLFIDPNIKFIEHGHIEADSAVYIYNMVLLLGFIFYGAYHTFTLHRRTLQDHQRNLQDLYNKKTAENYDKLQGFRHDFANVLATIGGYVAAKEYVSLESYIKDFALDMQDIKSYSDLDNVPALRGVIVSALAQCDLLGLPYTLKINVPSLNLDYITAADLSRVMGILLENAWQAASISPAPHVNISVVGINNNRNYRITVSNTFLPDKDFDRNKLTKKGISSKPGHTGFGLYSAHQIIKKYQAKEYPIMLKTSIDQDLFIQELVL